jgi:hypothetical protein
LFPYAVRQIHMNLIIMRTNGDVRLRYASNFLKVRRNHEAIQLGLGFLLALITKSLENSWAAELAYVDIRLGTVIMSSRLVTVMRRAVTDTHITSLVVVLPAQNP